MIDTNEIRALLSDDDYEIYDSMVYELLDEIDYLRSRSATLPVPAEVTVVARVEGE